MAKRGNPNWRKMKDGERRERIMRDQYLRALEEEERKEELKYAKEEQNILR